MGEISTAMIAARYGMFGRDRPSAATVPSVVDRMVLKNAMMTLFLTAVFQRSLMKNSSYQRSDHSPRGKLRNEELLKLIGMTIRIGEIRNSSTRPQKM